MTDPDCIIQSKAGPLAKTRTGSMLYARKLEPGPGYVMVPAKTTDQVEQVNGVEYAPGTAMLGLSVIPTEELPQRRRIYTRPTSKKKP